MKCRIILQFLILVTLSSCINKTEKKYVATIDRYTHYLLHGLKNKRPSFDIQYSFSKLNDSVILMKMYKYGDLDLKSIDYSLGNKMNDTLDYQKWFLCLESTLKNDIADSQGTNNEFYVMDSKHDFTIAGEIFRVFTFLRDHDEIDGDVRVFFNPKIGFLAEYSHSGFDARICWKSNDIKTNDIKTNDLRTRLIEMLITEENFFPYPKECYSSPPLSEKKQLATHKHRFQR